MLLTSDITFSGTTTSPVVLFLRKEHVENLHYKTCVIGSPKYFLPTGKSMKTKEVGFLGYEFSQNRAKSGTTIHQKSVLKDIAPIFAEFIKCENIRIPDNLRESMNVKYLDEILLNKEDDYVGDLYPKYVVSDGKSLCELCKINHWQEDDFEEIPKQYAEISDLSNLSGGKKKKKSTRFCKQGDILISSLCPTKKHIVISDGEYMLSSAIHVLSHFPDNKARDDVYKKLKEENVLSQMNTMLDGFKVTYAKISQENLYNNVKI